MPVIDGDSHFMEPFDLFESHCEPAFRERVCRVGTDPGSGERTLLVDGKPMLLLDVEELLGALVGYGQKEAGKKLSTFDRYAIENPTWQDMNARVRFLDEEGFDAQVIYPSMGLLWEGSVEDPMLADVLCRGYNRWAFELCADHPGRLYPAAHISLRDAKLAVAELERVAKLGARTAFVAAMPVGGRSLGHADLDPVWAAAQDLDLSVSLHLVGHPHYTGHQYYRDTYPGFMFVTMNVIQDPRMALTTMVYDGVLERFPRLRVATIEAMVGWVGEWIERLNYRFGYMKDTSKMKRPADEYFARNIWVCGDPEEKMFPHIVRFAGDEKFFFGSDFPHAEGFIHPIQSLREGLAELPKASIDKIVNQNAANFFRLEAGDSATIDSKEKGMSDLEERLQRLEDIEAIRALKARYCAYCDDGYDPDGLAALFTEDAVWDGGRLGRFEGREAIRAFFADASKIISFALHNVMNPLIEVDGDTATGRWYLLQPCTLSEGNQAVWLSAHYHDRYRRIGDAWKFESVDIDLKFLTPYEEGWAKTGFMELGD